MENQPMDVTSDDKLWGALSYVFAPIVGIIVLLMEDKKARRSTAANRAIHLRGGSGPSVR